ncbi:unnamed protein product [Laminaria digitata]
MAVACKVKCKLDIHASCTQLRCLRASLHAIARTCMQLHAIARNLHALACKLAACDEVRACNCTQVHHILTATISALFVLFFSVPGTHFWWLAHGGHRTRTTSKWHPNPNANPRGLLGCRAGNALGRCALTKTLGLCVWKDS